MKKILFSLLAGMAFSAVANAQESVYPASKQTAPVIIMNGTVHVGNGQVLNNTSVEIRDGKITNIGAGIAASADAFKVDAKGKHVYPGLILANSNLGLVEISTVRATDDETEIGEYNPSVRSIVAYNPDSNAVPYTPLPLSTK